MRVRETFSRARKWSPGRSWGDGPTALVLLGRGRLEFSPKAEAERGQVRIFSGAEALKADFDAVFVRVPPEEFGTRVAAETLKTRPVDAGHLRRASQIFETYVPKSFQLDLDDLLSRIAETDDRIAVIDSRRKLVDEVQNKANAIAHLLEDVRINMESLGERKAVVEHTAERVAQLEFMLQEARTTIRTLQHEREVAERIEQNIKQLRAKTAPPIAS